MKPFNNTKPKELTFKKKQALHGDVIIEKIDSFNSDNLSLCEDGILAHGEMTGHMHKLFKQDPDLPAQGEFTLKQSSQGDKFLVVEKPVILKHQEHDARIIPKGKYKIAIQREYDPFLKIARQVAD